MENILTEKQPNRNAAVDLFRCFGIVLMIMGHIGFGGLFDKYIHAFHMPMWFVITGMFCKPDAKTLDYIRRKAFKLFVPYFVFGIVYELICTIRGGYQWNGMLWPNSIQIPIAGALWFLPALFFVSVIGFVALKHLPKMLSICLLGVIALLGSFHPIELPLALDSALIGLGYFLLGYLIQNYAKILLDLKWYIVFLLLAGNVLLIFVNGYVNLRSCECANVPLFWLNGITATIGFYNLCRIVSARFDFLLLRKIGSDTMIYICTNQIILLIFNKICAKMVFACDNILLVIGFKLLALLIVVIAGLAMNCLIINSPVSWIIGKQRKLIRSESKA